MKAWIAVTAAAMALAGAPAHAQGSAGHAGHHPAPGTSASVAGETSEGEVRKVDRSTRKITLKHGPIPNLEMPPMTMVCVAGDPAMLDRVKVGDKVRFTADKVGGQYTVTRIEPAK